MSVVEKAIEIDVPVRTVYNQWTQFEEFPQFMEGVKQVTQLDDKHLHWKADIGGKKKNGMPKSSSRSPTSELRGGVRRAR